MNKLTKPFNSLPTSGPSPLSKPISLLSLLAGASALLFACSTGPTPFTPSERADILALDRSNLLAHQEEVQRPISLFEAMARALKYNLEHRVILLEKAVSQNQLTLSHFSLLPEITANGALKTRSTLDAASGSPVTNDGEFEVKDNDDPATYSAAQDRSKASANMTMVWNVLDFGVSVIEARQESDRVMIAKENQRKTVHELIQRVRATFWQAAGAQKLEEAINIVLKQARKALDDARQVEKERLKPLLEILRYQKTLMGIVQQFQDLRHQLSLAKTEFASLINLPPGTEFTLEIADDEALTIPSITMTIEEMEQLALDNRPELRQKMYEARISSADVRKAMLRLMPNLNFQVSQNWDSNSFTLFPQWQEAGATVAWSIWNLVKSPVTIRSAENKKQLAHISRMTKHMAILAEVHLSYHRYLNDQRKLRSAEEIDSVDRRILDNISATSQNSADSQLEYISSAAGAIMSRLQLYQAYADAQNAVGMIYSTLGVDLTPKAVRSDDISILAEALRLAVMEWNHGASDGPLQQLLNQLHKPTAVSTMVTAADQEPEKEHAIPSYFLDTQILPDIEMVTEELLLSSTEELSDEENLDSDMSDLDSSDPMEREEDELADTPEVASDTEAEKSQEMDPEQVKKLVLWRPGETDKEPAETELYEEINTLLRAWAEAWSRREPEAYFAFYDAKHFIPPHHLSHSEWRNRMAKTIRTLTFLQIDFGDLEVVRELPNEDAEQTEPYPWLQVAFRESYRSNNLQSIYRKLMVLAKSADGWKIIREEPLKIPQPGDQEEPPGYALQIELLEHPQEMERSRKIWLEHGYYPLVVEMVDEKDRVRYGIRIGYSTSQIRTIMQKWSLQLKYGVDGTIVTANKAEMDTLFPAEEPETENRDTPANQEKDNTKDAKQDGKTPDPAADKPQEEQPPSNTQPANDGGQPPPQQSGQ